MEQTTAPAEPVSFNFPIKGDKLAPRFIKFKALKQTSKQQLSHWRIQGIQLYCNKLSKWDSLMNNKIFFYYPYPHHVSTKAEGKYCRPKRVNSEEVF